MPLPGNTPEPVQNGATARKNISSCVVCVIGLGRGWAGVTSGRSSRFWGWSRTKPYQMLAHLHLWHPPPPPYCGRRGINKKHIMAFESKVIYFRFLIWPEASGRYQSQAAAASESGQDKALP